MDHEVLIMPIDPPSNTNVTRSELTQNRLLLNTSYDSSQVTPTAPSSSSPVLVDQSSVGRTDPAFDTNETCGIERRYESSRTVRLRVSAASFFVLIRRRRKTIQGNCMCGVEATRSDAEQLDYLERYMNPHRECVTGPCRGKIPITSTNYTEDTPETP